MAPLVSSAPPFVPPKDKPKNKPALPQSPRFLTSQLVFNPSDAGFAQFPVGFITNCAVAVQQFRKINMDARQKTFEKTRP